MAIMIVLMFALMEYASREIVQIIYCPLEKLGLIVGELVLQNVQQILPVYQILIVPQAYVLILYAKNRPVRIK